MRLTSKLAAIAVTLALISGSTPAGAIAIHFESGPVIDGTLEYPTTSTTVKLRLVRDKSERTRILAVARLSGVLLPLTGSFPQFDPNAGLNDCELEVQSVHFRKFTDFKRIGPKAFTICSRRVNVILHHTTLEYRQGSRWNPVLPVYKDHAINTKILLSTEIEHPCKGFRRTQWRSTTTAYVIDGHRYYRKSVVSKPQFIECGP